MMLLTLAIAFGVLWLGLKANKPIPKTTLDRKSFRSTRERIVRFIKDGKMITKDCEFNGISIVYYCYEVKEEMFLPPIQTKYTFDYLVWLRWNNNWELVKQVKQNGWIFVHLETEFGPVLLRVW